MNVENIKSELQQVLDSDVVLRKEYNEIKRSLSDYRNQLIQRDEDCKRLQVSIDILNTKLVVMERDNLNYKNEVGSFKELRDSISEQLQEKQNEINALLSKIEELNHQMASISSEYEAKINQLNYSSQQEISDLKTSYEAQLSELKSNTTYQQSGIRSELEAKIDSLTTTYNTTYQETVSSYETQIEKLKLEFNIQLESVKNESQNHLASISGSNEQAILNVSNEYELKINKLTAQWDSEKAEITSSYENQISSLTGAFSAEKSDLVNTYELQIADLNAELSSKQEVFETELQSKIDSLIQSYSEKENELKSFYEDKLSNTSHSSESLIEAIKTEFEVKNVELSDNLNKVVIENEHFKEKIREMVYFIDEQNTKIDALTKDIEIKAEEINKQIDNYNSLSSQYEVYKTSQLSSVGEQVNNLNLKISEFEASIIEKDSSIKDLTISLEEKINQNIILTNSLEELQNSTTQIIQNKEIEFEKLLVENTSLISEIDTVSDKLEIAEAELNLVKSELTEIKASTEIKVLDLKETLDAKNYEITALAANNIALQTELEILKAELDNVRGELKLATEANESNASLHDEINALILAKTELENQIAFYKSSINTLNSQISELNNTILSYQKEIASLKISSQTNDQESVITRLSNQINILSDERLSLLNEKEEMANQLLKMNETVFEISQHVDSHEINISELDNHRKNVILAGSSNNVSSDKTIIKKQINELVREIDKCIALLSA